MQKKIRFIPPKLAPESHVTFSEANCTDYQDLCALSDRICQAVLIPQNVQIPSAWVIPINHTFVKFCRNYNIRLCEFSFLASTESLGHGIFKFSFLRLYFLKYGRILQ